MCSAASTKTTLGLGAALDGVELVPAPWLGQGWWICSEVPGSLEEMGQWTPQMVLAVLPLPPNPGKRLLCLEGGKGSKSNIRTSSVLQGHLNKQLTPGTWQSTAPGPDVQQDHHYQIVWGQAATCGT